MDISVKTLDNTHSNIKLLISKGYKLSSVSKPDGLYKVIRYSCIRKEYWFTTGHVARCIDGGILRSQIKTLIII